MAKPIVTQYASNPNGGKEIQEKLLNSEPNKFAYCSNDSVEVLYNHYVNGKPLPKNMMLDDEEAKVNNTKGSESDTNGRTVGTTNSIYKSMEETFNLFLTTQPKKIVEDILGNDFTDSKEDIKDPAKVLLDRERFLTIFNRMKETVQLLNEQHNAQNDRMTEVLKVYPTLFFNRETKKIEATN